MSGVRSMTGFARVRRTTPRGELIVSLKSVNHRGLDLHFHLGVDLDRYESSLRAAVKRHLQRGHIDIRINFVRTRAVTVPAINRDLLAAWHRAFCEAAAELGVDSKPDLNSALRIPGMFSEPIEEEFEADFEADLLSAMEEALAALNEFRAREGQEIAAELLRHNTSIAQAAAQIEELRNRALPAFQERLNQRLSELLSGAGIDPQRVAQEAAILTDRSDVGEEIARLKIHSGQIQSILEAGGEVGKRLDFLLQEMNRETNTILSKTGGIGEIGLKITDLALSAKSSIEKIREQALNLE